MRMIKPSRYVCEDVIEAAPVPGSRVVAGTEPPRPPEPVRTRGAAALVSRAGERLESAVARPGRRVGRRHPRQPGVDPSVRRDDAPGVDRVVRIPLPPRHPPASFVDEEDPRRDVPG